MNLENVSQDSFFYASMIRWSINFKTILVLYTSYFLKNLTCPIPSIINAKIRSPICSSVSDKSNAKINPNACKDTNNNSILLLFFIDISPKCLIFNPTKLYHIVLFYEKIILKSCKYYLEGYYFVL